MNKEKRLIIKKSALTNAINAVIFTNLERKLTFVNSAFLKMWGYNSENEVLGRPFSLLFDAKKTEDIMQELVNNGKWQGELVARKKDGSQFNAYLSINMVKDPSGEELCMTGTVLDITKLKKEEKILKRKLEIERTISNITSRFIGVYDLNKAIDTTLSDIGTVSGASRAYLFLFRQNGTIMDNTNEWRAEGVSKEKDNLQNLQVEMFPWWMKQLNEKKIIHIPDISQLPPEASAEKKILSKQDIRSLFVLPLHIKNELIGYIGMDDVTRIRNWDDEDFLILCTASELIANAIELKRLESELIESKERYKRLVEKTNHIPYVMDINGTITYVGPQAEKYGIIPENLIYSNFLELIIPEDRESVYRDFRNAMELGIEAVSTFRIDTPKMGIRCFEDAGIILKDDEGEIVGLTGMLEDVTERKRMEEKLKTQVKEARLLSLLDDLTGLYNRRGFFTLAGQQKKLSLRKNEKMLLVYIDVDHLKKINDKFGHRVGSLALIETANIIKETFRKSDIAARIGGDEFVVLAIESSTMGEESIIKRLLKNLDKHNNRRKKFYDYTLALSFGIAHYNPKSETTINDLVDEADRLMYEQKKLKSTSGLNKKVISPKK